MEVGSPISPKEAKGDKAGNCVEEQIPRTKLALPCAVPGNDDWYVTNNINDGNWHHLVGTFGDGKRSIYVDGVLAGQEDRTGTVNATGSALVFGARDNSGVAGVQNIGNYSSIFVDEVRFYNTSLTLAEVESIFQGDFLQVPINIQYRVMADNNPSSYGIEGTLPFGLSIDSGTGRILGRPLEVGSFDLNMTASNVAGKGSKPITFIVDPAAPEIATIAPAEITATSARIAARVISDGGEPSNLKFFWGDNDGGENLEVNQDDNISWDYRIDLNDSFTDGTVSAFLTELDRNHTYYYRVTAGNTVKPVVWSTPTESDLTAWWRFDESSGSSALDSVGGQSGSLIGMTDVDRVFGQVGKALSFGGAGEHVSVTGYKGISGTNARTVAAWIKTAESSGGIASWGENVNGALWHFEVNDGNCALTLTTAPSKARLS